MRIRRLGLPASTLLRACALAVAGISFATTAGSQVPITLDGSVGPAGDIPGAPQPGGGREYVIPSSAGTASDGNLFHSFGRFGIPSGDAARFTQANGETFSNVISRVTGGDVSTIAGLLKSEVAGADFYLLNPAGVVFAPGAKIDVPAALHISTADGIHFADSEVFAAEGTPDTDITTAPIPAFGFLGPAAGDVIVESGAVLSNRSGLSLEGRNVLIASKDVETQNGDLWLRADREVGRIALGDGAFVEANSLDDARISLSAAEVLLDGGATLRLGVLISGAQAPRIPKGMIHIDADAVNVREDASILAPATFGIGPDIQLDAERIDLRGAGRIVTGTGTDASAGDVRLRASEWVKVGGRTTDNQEAGISTLTRSPGAAGDILIETPELVLTNEGIVTARTDRSSGPAGDVTLRVGTLEVHSGSRVEVETGNLGTGAAGKLRVEASEGVWVDGVSERDPDSESTLSAIARASSGGEITIEAPDVRVTDRALIDGGTFRDTPGDGSDIRVRTARVEVSGDGVIDATSRGSGRAGNVEVVASERISIADGDIVASANGSGPGGLVRLVAPDVELTQGGVVSVDAQKVDLEVTGGGDAGRIEIGAARVALSGGGRLLSTTRDVGRGGDIDVVASESVQLDGAPLADRLEQTRIASDTEGDGVGGTIRIETPYLRVGRFAIIETNSTGAAGHTDVGPFVEKTGPAGAIEIRADRIDVQRNGQIASQSRGSTNTLGDGGSIDIDTGSLHVAPGGQIDVQSSANGDAGNLTVRASREVVLESEAGTGRNLNSLTERAGRGGRIEVETPRLALVNGGGIVATSSGSGDAGSVDVRAGQIEISGGGQIVADTLGTGAGGDVAVAGDAILVRGEREFGPSRIATRSFGPGAGGSVSVRAGTLALEDGAEITASSAGSGDAGAVSIAAREGLRLENARIATSAPQADGGRIEVRSGGRVELRASSIAADVGDGRGGDVLIAPAELLLLDGSSITAQAGAGQGGAIRIVADVVVVSQDSVVSASAGAQGIDGTVHIEAPGYDFTTSLQALPADFVDTVTLLGERCAARRAARASFVVNVATESDAGPDRLLPVVAAGGEPEVPGTERVALALEPTAVAGRWQVRCDG